MDIDKLITEIIPLNNYHHREGFNNEFILNELTDNEKSQVEKKLISMLAEKFDVLIIETLSILKSRNSLPQLYSLLNSTKNNSLKIIISVSIYTIIKDEQMIDVAINSFKKLEKKIFFKNSNIPPMLYYLQKFNNQKTNMIIKSYPLGASMLQCF